jgi:predicted metal-dependent HD superfamily phosphohydrolase
VGPLAGVWTQAAVRLGGDRRAAAASGTDLEARYAQPHRRYHTGEHVAAVLRDSARLAAGLALEAADRAVLVLAACAHDVVYDAQPGADERASAAWARAHLTGSGIAEPVVRRVESLVLATLTHTGDATEPCLGALLDADLAILGAEPDDYAGYVSRVRAEYGSLPDAQWRAGRAQVLRALLARNPLYLTGLGRELWSTAARRNVGAELAALES